MQELRAKPIVAAIKSGLQERVKKFKEAHSRAPKLVVVLVGNDPASVIYTTNKGKAALAVGMEHETLEFPVQIQPSKLKAAIQELNDNPNVDGILIQRPLPKNFSEQEVQTWIHPSKDVDAFHPENAGRLFLGVDCLTPCTPAGIMEILKHYKANLTGKIACVVGRSSIVGKPIAQLLMQADATIIHCHSKTQNLAHWTKQADVLVVAAGKRHLIKKSHVKEGAIVIDVGIHRGPDGKVTGDVDFVDASTVASAITPVPGGVGPMTINMLLLNTMKAAEWRAK